MWQLELFIPNCLRKYFILFRVRRRRPFFAWSSVSWGKSAQPDSESLQLFFSFSFSFESNGHGSDVRVVRTPLPSSVLPWAQSFHGHEHVESQSGPRNTRQDLYFLLLYQSRPELMFHSGPCDPLANALRWRRPRFCFYPTDVMKEKHDNHLDRKWHHCRSFPHWPRLIIFFRFIPSLLYMFIFKWVYINFSKYPERTNPIQACAASTSTKAAEGGRNFYNDAYWSSSSAIFFPHNYNFHHKWRKWCFNRRNTTQIWLYNCAMASYLKRLLLITGRRLNRIKKWINKTRTSNSLTLTLWLRKDT